MQSKENTKKISEPDCLQKELWNPIDEEDLVFAVVEEAFVKDSLKIDAKEKIK